LTQLVDALTVELTGLQSSREDAEAGEDVLSKVLVITGGPGVGKTTPI
jgi:hypothetical protein